MSQSSQNGSKKSYIRDLQAYAWIADVMPDKEAHGRKFKRAERQRGKKEIRDALKDSKRGISEDDLKKKETDL